MLTAALVVTVLVLESCSALDNMGTCTSNYFQTDTEFNFKEFPMFGTDEENSLMWCKSADAESSNDSGQENLRLKIKFAGENGGKWCIVRGPKTNFTLDLKTFSYFLTEKKKNVYNLKIYYLRKNLTDQEKPLLYTDEEMMYLGGGVANSSGISIDEKKETFTLTISFIKYVPKRYVYYHVCSPNGAYKTIDFRYVLAYSKLKQNEVDDINKIDQVNGFRGELIPIGNSNR